MHLLITITILLLPMHHMKVLVTIILLLLFQVPFILILLCMVHLNTPRLLRAAVAGLKHSSVGVRVHNDVCYHEF